MRFLMYIVKVIKKFIVKDIRHIRKFATQIS